MTDKQHSADLARVSSQNSVTDFVRGVEDGPQGGFLDGIIRSAVEATPFGQAIAARTDFDKRDLPLNEMIDLVRQTDPEDLESSGKVLWDARDAIKAAADELDGHIDRVHWVGESGEAFRTWGSKLVTNTHHLSEFAGAAGDQITAAAVGLASVRGAMPSRDTHPNRMRPDSFTAAEKAANTEEYAAAVKVEKDRQEAINQMNRLASYYAVSEEALASLPAKDKTPEFTTMPDVGVPPPRDSEGTPTSSTGSHASGGTASPAGQHAIVTGGVGRHVLSDGSGPTKDIPSKIAHSDAPVGTNIDSVGTLPPPTTTPVTGHTPPIVGTSPTQGGPPTVFEGGFRAPTPNGSMGRGLSGAGGFRTSAPAEGRAGTPGLTNPGSGRSTGQGPVNQMGRPTSTGPSAVKGTTSAPKASPMARGVTGGTPRVAGTATPRANGGLITGASRSNGVVGGRPATGGASAKGAARIPRGTVIGDEERPTTGPRLPGQGSVASSVRPSPRRGPVRA
ncbi:WXG100 family type VII secretion target [Streptomyces chiangmaiensis]